MIAALLTQINKPLELQQIQPMPLDFGQVKVKVLASGICGAQLQEIRGEKGTHFPRLMGHEGVGIVQECGPGVTHVAVGDKVVMHWRKGAGIESPPPRYTDGESVFTGGQVVTFADIATCSENRLTKVPQDTPDEFCTLLGCSLSTALSTIEQEAKLKFGERILIIGCGGLGLNLIRAAKLAQASWVYAVDCVWEKRFAAQAAGADGFNTASGGGLYDVVVDTSGVPAAIEDGIRCLGPSGRLILVGQPPPLADVVVPHARRLFTGTGITIKATQGGGFNPTTDIPRYVAMHRAGLLDLSGIITHRLPLEKINDGINLVNAGEAGRVLIIP